MIPLLSAGALSLLVAGFGTPILLRWLIRWRIGQQIRADGPAHHTLKAGTPTMGGIAILIAVVVGYCLGHVGTSAPFTRSAVLVLGAIVAAGAVGAADDWIKVRRRRSLGLNVRWKTILLIAVAVAFCVAEVNWGGIHTTISFTRYDVPGTQLGPVLWVVWGVLIIYATANSVNLTDGLDGLAAGSAAFVFAFLALVGFIQYRHPEIYRVHSALDLGLVAVAMCGACVGFLWWNAAPARIIMGDTGSLAIGTGIACLALTMNVQLLLPIICGLFVLVTLSVIIQVVSFKTFHRRVFLMAPLHHHFELKGWPETTVTIRFWIISGLCVAFALGLFYADFLSTGPLK
ncbi:MAG: phospho-N-acetylmuramoyl-pentapeptide-transferase [Acidimicrobiales bacterium]|jgi:phospho-N-acetylmuramoyl-pentapeptide-transferase